MPSAHRVLLLATGVGAAICLAGTSLAGEAVAPSFSVRPVLVKATGGALVHYQLDRRAIRTRVEIAGHAARVRREGGAEDAVYDGFVKDADLRSGATYAVSIAVVSATGGTATRREKLLLHRRFPRG